MTTREKIAFQNLKISIWDECADEVRILSLHEPKHLRDVNHSPDDIRSEWFSLTQSLIERIDEKKDHCRAQITKILDTESDQAA